MSFYVGWLGKPAISLKGIETGAGVGGMGEN